eukprot:m.326807 g.326807  ORF g.326807 m.326807 type:complete len:65 (+) comp16487_c0_seq1:240-434(+)
MYGSSHHYRPSRRCSGLSQDRIVVLRRVLVNYKDDSKSSRFAIALARYEAEVVDGNGLVGCDVM